MGTEQVKSEIRRFLKAEDKYALCLSGKWGVGKTHTWEELLKKSFEDKSVNPSRYAYVSLFGLESLSQVRRSIFENTVEAAAFNTPNPFEASLKSISDRLAPLAAQWRTGFGIVLRLPVISDYAGALEAGFLEVRDQIVCFDDLERMSKDLSLKDVLGLISLLKEKKRCKVVLLLNSDALEGQDAEDYKIQLEKVIDISLVFAPTVDEAVNIAIPNRSNLLTRSVAENATLLEITNIRTIFKLRRICERISEVLNSYDERIVQQAFQSACLFGFAIYQPHEAPPLEWIKKYNQFSDLFDGGNNTSKERIQHVKLLQRYGFNSVDGFDLLILNCIKTGVYDQTRLRQGADEMTKKLNYQDDYAAFNATWNIFNDSFDDNAENFVEELKRSIKEHAVAISPSSLSSSIKTLKKLGHAEEVDEVIQAYVDNRDDGVEFWTGKSDMPGLEIEDEDVAEAFAAKASKFDEDRKLHEVVKSIVRQRGWNDGTLEFIDQHSVEDYYRELKAAKGQDLHLLVWGLTSFRDVQNPNESMKSISEKAVSALQRIGRESEINRLRVAKFGVELPEEKSKDD